MVRLQRDLALSSSFPMNQEDAQEALGPAISWAGVPGALVGGVWLSMSSRARAWRLARQLVARLSLVAESAPSWGE